MASIKLSTLLGTHIKKVQSGSEIIFLYELARYTKEILNKDLDFEDIQVKKELRESDYLYYASAQGLNLNYTPIGDKKDLTEISRKFFTGDLSKIVLKEQTPERWVYNYKTNTTKNLVLNQFNRSAGYVSLYCLMLVAAYKVGQKVPMLVLENTSYKQEEMEYVDILILRDFGNKFLKDKVEIKYSKEVVIQPEWEAYIMYNRQLGKMTEEVESSVKEKYIRKNFQEGDVVLFYKTEKAIRSKTIRKLVTCYPAVISFIGPTSMTINYYTEIKTLLTTKRDLKHAEEVCGGDLKYSSEDYKRFLKNKLTLNYFAMGIDEYFYTEDTYLITPFNGEDKFKQYLVDKDGIEGAYYLDTVNTIYAVFEDRGVSYNKERFLEKFFKKEKPVYDVVLGRD